MITSRAKKIIVLAVSVFVSIEVGLTTVQAREGGKLAAFNQQHPPEAHGSILSWIDCGKSPNAVTVHRGLMVVPISFDFGGGEGHGAFVAYNIDDPRKPVNVFDSRKFPKRFHDPASKHYLGDIGEIHAMFFHQDKVLLQEKGHDHAGFMILDLGPLYDDDAKTLPAIVCRYAFPGVERATIYDGFSFSPAWVGGRYVFAPTGTTGLFIIDTQDLDRPRLISHLTKSQLYNQVPRSAHPVGDLLVLSPAAVATKKEDLVFMDISDPAHPTLIGQHKIELGYQGFVYGTKFYNGGFAESRGEDPLSRIIVYDFADPTNVTETVLGTPRDKLFRPEYIYVQDDDLFIGHYPGLSKWKIDGDLATFEVGVEPQFPPVNDYAFVSPLGNLTVVTSDHEVQSKLSIGVHSIDPDRTPPELRHVSPQPGQTNVSEFTKIGISFSDFIDNACLENGALQLVEAHTGQPVECAFSHGMSIVHVVPSKPLQNNTSYRLMATENLIDMVGNPYQGDAMLTEFSTGAEFTQYRCDIVTDVPRAIGAAVKLQAKVNVAELESEMEYSWDFGDGTQPTSFNRTPTAERSYSQPGNYRITLAARRKGSDRVVRSSAVQVVYQPSSKPSGAVSSSTLSYDAATKQLAVANPDNDTLTCFDTTTGEVIYEMPTGKRPVSIVRVQTDQSPGSKVEDHFWVACNEDDKISIHSAHDGSIIRELPLGYGSAPHGVICDAGTGRCFVALTATGVVQEFNARDADATRTFQLQGPLRELAYSPRHDVLIAPQLIASGQQGAILQWVDVENGSIRKPQTLEATTDHAGLSGGPGFPNYLNSIAVNPQQTQLWIAGKKDNLFRGLQRDGDALEFDQTVRSIALCVDLESQTEDPETRIDFDNSDFATAATFNSNGNVLYVATMGTSTINAIDAYSPGNRSVFDTYGAGAIAMVGNEDGTRLFVHNQLSRQISAFDAEPDGSLDHHASWTCVANEKMPDDVLSGKRIFHDSSRANLSREGYMSCASCHIDGGHDQRVWDLSNLGEGLRNTIDLRGKAGMKHGQLHWTGNFDEVQDFDDQIRNLNQGTGFLVDAIKPGLRKYFPSKAGMMAELDSLAVFVSSLNQYPRSPHKTADGTMTATALRGRQHFVAMKCYQCHSGPTFTDSSLSVLHDVGTQKTTTGTRLGKPLTGLDTPTLIGLWQSAPYLHDGSAETLRDVFHAGEGEAARAHQVFQDLPTEQQTELLDFLMQLDSEDGITAEEVGDSSGPPQFAQSEVELVYPYRYDHRKHLVGTVAAQPDAAGRRITYRIAPSVYSTLFRIDADSGELTFGFKDIFFRDIANKIFEETRTYPLEIVADAGGDFVQSTSIPVTVQVVYPKLMLENKELNELRMLNGKIELKKRLTDKDKKRLEFLHAKINQ